MRGIRTQKKGKRRKASGLAYFGAKGERKAKKGQEKLRNAAKRSRIGIGLQNGKIQKHKKHKEGEEKREGAGSPPTS